MSSLFTDFDGWNMGFITNQLKFEQNLGHKADRVKSLKAGNLDTSLYIFKGKK